MSLTSKRNRGGQLPDIIIEDIVINSESSDSFAVEGQFAGSLQNLPDVPSASVTNLPAFDFELSDEQVEGFDESNITLPGNSLEVSDDRTGFFFLHITSFI